MSYKFASPHPYVDLSKRKPYICATCLKDITHPIHQPNIPGTEYVAPRREESAEVEAPRRVEDNQTAFAF